MRTYQKQHNTVVTEVELRTELCLGTISEW